MELLLVYVILHCKEQQFNFNIFIDLFDVFICFLSIRCFAAAPSILTCRKNREKARF